MALREQLVIDFTRAEREFAAMVGQMRRALGNIDVDIAGLDRVGHQARSGAIELDRLGREASSLSNVKIDVRADADQAEAEIERVARAAAGIEDETVQIRGDGSDAVAEAQLAQRAVDSVDDRHVKITADGSDAIAEAGEVEDAFSGGLSGAFSSIDGLVGKATSVGGLAGTALGGALVAGFAEVVSRDAALTDLAIITGDSEQAGAAAADAWARGFGDTFADVTASAASLELNLDGLTLGAAFDDLLAQAETFGRVFRADVDETARAAGQLIRTGLADDADEAFDVIAAGFTAGLDRGGDFLDTINEYSPAFQRLGLDASDALALLDAGLGAGARNTDVFADALLEFGIRTSEVSARTAAAFDAIGLNAAEMNRAFLDGGASAEGAFDATVAAIAAIEDPVEQNRVAVELFGTKLEDLGPQAFTAMAVVRDEFDMTAGAAEEMAARVEESLGGEFAQFTRGVTDRAVGFLDGVVRGAQDAGSAINDFLTPLEDAIASGARDILGDSQFSQDLANGLFGGDGLTIPVGVEIAEGADAALLSTAAQYEVPPVEIPVTVDAPKVQALSAETAAIWQAAFDSQASPLQASLDKDIDLTAFLEHVVEVETAVAEVGANLNLIQESDLLTPDEAAFFVERVTEMGGEAKAALTAELAGVLDDGVIDVDEQSIIDQLSAAVEAGAAAADARVDLETVTLGVVADVNDAQIRAVDRTRVDFTAVADVDRSEVDALSATAIYLDLRVDSTRARQEIAELNALALAIGVNLESGGVVPYADGGVHEFQSGWSVGGATPFATGTASFVAGESWKGPESVIAGPRGVAVVGGYHDPSDIAANLSRSGTLTADLIPALLDELQRIAPQDLTDVRGDLHEIADAIGDAAWRTGGDPFRRGSG